MIGFTKFDNPILEKILASDLTKRQLKILLLILRFSSGYQKTYAVLRRTDFESAGVSQSCINEELTQLTLHSVIGWDPSRDMVWINSQVHTWDVDNSGDKPAEFHKLAAMNSPKRQLALFQKSQRDLFKTGSEERDRNKTKDSSFFPILTSYYLMICPLGQEETDRFTGILEAYGPYQVTDAIKSAASVGDHTFNGFLKGLDRVTGLSRTGTASPLRSSLSRIWKSVRGS